MDKCENKLKKLEAENKLMRRALKQILGWRELRTTNAVPIDRIEEIAKATLKRARELNDD